MEKKSIFWMISVLLSSLGFFLIENTFTIQPDVNSGNGNLGLLIIMLFSPVFIASYILTFKLAKEKSNNVKNRKMHAWILLLSLIFCVFLMVAILNYANELVIALGGTPANPDSRIYRFGWFNQYTNSIYFNVYTFLMSHMIVVMAGVLSVISKFGKQEKNTL
ncbi:hypothetical protein V7654_05295 [Bacillus sp. JJ1609]|uniref:hypothetical protein n=1 Tax=Bacillus sp. JJ1609 TaxID=3122977 RepID=UPI002FFF69A6